MRVIKAQDYVRVPWKNGGGETAEIVVSPPGTGTGTFDWRVSMARVAADGPFSNFPGIDRTLAVVEGNGLFLTVDGQWPVELLPFSEPFRFAGDMLTRATLVRGEVLDFNVMTRRERCSHHVQRFRIPAQDLQLEIEASVVLVFCQSGALRVQCGSVRGRVSAHDTFLCEGAPGPLQLHPESPAVILVAAISKASLESS